MNYILSKDFTVEEEVTIKKYCGDNYIVLASIEGEHYILNKDGQLSYKECFKTTSNNYLSIQKYEKANPIRLIKFFQFYIMENNNEKGIWYRGKNVEIGKYEYDIYGDSLEEIFESL